MNIAINGFGRIGRTFYRAACGGDTNLHRLEHKSTLNIVAANDLGKPEDLKHLLQYDSVYGQAAEEVMVQAEKMRFLAEKEPEKLPWKELDVDVVIESSGRFTEKALAAKHLQAGAKQVIISAPADDADVTLIPGVNLDQYDSNKHQVISMGSCTTNCLVPVAYILNKELGIEKGSMVTVHSYTAEQNLMDGPHHKDLRRARSAAENIIPTSTGAAKAIFQVIPELKGKMFGTALRVPTPTVSIIDLTVVVKKSTNKEEINKLFAQYADNQMKGILAVSKEKLVSSDFRGSPYSSIIDAEYSEVIDGNLVHLTAWYDNEMGYSYRLVDLCEYISKKF